LCAAGWCRSNWTCIGELLGSKFDCVSTEDFVFPHFQAMAYPGVIKKIWSCTYTASCLGTEEISPHIKILLYCKTNGDTFTELVLGKRKGKVAPVFN
jgi:hypothetical protein